MNGGQSQADRVLLGVIQEHTDPERDRQIVELRLKSPNRSTHPQHDASDCPLFRAADEPRLL
ncbi:MAG: hypothetical protein MK060_15760 [Blastomonas sp.]|uniref:hypothetical protein n=1 Tax=Blastomonas sp. TaxID=1909299 RepID=UPI00406A84A6|nr:hypothetical protein [Blastomonas sp.]